MLVSNLRLPAFARKGENKWGIEGKDSCTPLPVRVVTTLKGFCMSFKKAAYFEIFYQLFLSCGWNWLFSPSPEQLQILHFTVKVDQHNLNEFAVPEKNP